MPTVTVIIPVYKSSAISTLCGERCAAELCDLEILLVDDGSPDRCPALCDAWAEKDPRIKSSTGRTAVCPPRATPASTPPWASFCCSLTATTY